MTVNRQRRHFRQMQKEKNSHSNSTVEFEQSPHTRHAASNLRLSMSAAAASHVFITFVHRQSTLAPNLYYMQRLVKLQGYQNSSIPDLAGGASLAETCSPILKWERAEKNNEKYVETVTQMTQYLEPKHFLYVM